MTEDNAAETSEESPDTKAKQAEARAAARKALGMAESDPFHCSFCLKSQHEVQKLIAGPGGIFICDECVGLCDAIIAGAYAPSDGEKFKLGNIASETLLARLKPIDVTRRGKGNDLQAMVEELRGREVSWARIGQALGVSRQSAWERFS